MANDGRADSSHFNRLTPFGYQAAHSGILHGVGSNQTEQSHARTDIDECPVVTDPVANRYAEGDQLPGTAPDPVPVRPELTANADLLQCMENPALEAFDIIPYGKRCQASGTIG